MRLLGLLTLVLLAACEIDLTNPPTDPDAPRNLSYQLMPSGDPDVPVGLLLSWDPPSSGRAVSFDVYARSTGTGWLRRATTTSTTFHDAGVPQLEYYVAAMDGDGFELGQSETVLVDSRNRLPAPTGLTSISLNRAVQLTWSPNAVQSGADRFDHYRVYSAPYDGARGTCTAPWYFEGSTVSDGFLIGNMQNGVSLCFAVSAVARTGHESLWSAIRLDTPRPDARNAVVYATAVRSDSSAFVFFDEIAQKYGVVGSSARADADLLVQRQADGSLWFVPARAGVSMSLYSDRPVTDLTSIDRAPTTGYGNVTIEAVPGYAYVFRVQEGDGTHFGAARVAYATRDYVVLDWSYQPAVGNPELSRAPIGP